MLKIIGNKIRDIDRIKSLVAVAAPLREISLFSYSPAGLSFTTFQPAGLFFMRRELNDT